jgi:hypothetical protein
MNKIIKNKKIIILGIVGGLLLLLIGFMYEVIFAGIPYQDPTQFMIQNYNFHKAVGQKIELTGIVIMLLSILGIIVNKFLKPNKTG